MRFDFLKKNFVTVKALPLFKIKCMLYVILGLNDLAQYVTNRTIFFDFQDM